MSILDDSKKKMSDCVAHFQKELTAIRTGRANTALLDSVTVDMYGTKMHLTQLANVTIPESRQLLIRPFDKTSTQLIGKALKEANLGLSIVEDADQVRVSIPEMNQEVRQKMIKVIGSKLEEAKISVRNIRRDANDLAKKKKKAAEMTEDEEKSIEKHIQEFTDRFCKEMDVLAAKKEKDIMTI